MIGVPAHAVGECGRVLVGQDQMDAKLGMSLVGADLRWKIGSFKDLTDRFLIGFPIGVLLERFGGQKQEAYGTFPLYITICAVVGGFKKHRMTGEDPARLILGSDRGGEDIRGKLRGVAAPRPETLVPAYEQDGQQYCAGKREIPVSCKTVCNHQPH